MNKENFERAKWIPICLIAVLLMIIYKTIDNLTQITTEISRFLWVVSPLLFGVLFAYFLYIPHLKIESLFRKSKVRFVSNRARGFSTISVFLLLIMIVSFIIAVIIPMIITSIIDLANSIPIYVNSILDFFDDIPADSFWYGMNIADNLREATANILNEQLSFGAIEQFARGIISFAGGMFNILLGLVISLYILLEREKITEFFRRLSNAVIKKERARSRLTKYLGQINKVLFTFIASKGLDSIINLVAVTTILLIFRVPHAPLLGLLAGMFNFIPYLGSLIAVFLITTITLITGGVEKALIVLIPLLIFQQLDGNFIEPRIMKSSLKISPILVIIAVVVGGAYFGIFGMFLAVPIAVIIKQILIEYVSHSEEKS